MLITHNPARNRFEAILDSGNAWRAGYEAVKGAGFRFDGNVFPKVWYTTESLTAAKLEQYADEKAKAALKPEVIEAAKQAVQLKAESLETSRATSADIAIPAPASLEYLPYQRAGIAYAMKRANTMIGDEMGLGKTIQAIGISNADPSIRRVLIVCPASLKLNWQREWAKWDVKGLTIGRVSGRKGELPATDVTIINYDILEQRAAQLKEVSWDLLIADECHALKNPKAKRTQYLLGRRESYRVNKKTGKKDAAIAPIAAKRRAFLTGTPIVNRPVELWPLVESLDPEGLGKNFFGYAKRYCGAVQTRHGWDFSGASNLPELQDKLRATFMVRRLKADVLKELPPKRRQVVVLEAPDSLDEILQREKKAYAEFEKMGLSYDSVAFEAMSKVRAEVAVAKAPFVIEYAKETLEETDKIVIMAHHHEVVDLLAAAFGAAAVTVDGRTPQDERQAAVDRFQTDKDCKVFIGTIKAAGVGLTLTAASTVIFAELDWVPGNVTQAEDRCHRIGQTDTVMVKHLVLDGSLDARMVEIIIEKQSVIDRALDIKHENKQAQPPVGIQKAEPKAAKQARKPGEPEPLPVEMVAAIHQAIQYLAARCDGAQSEDGHGFNKLDTNFGHSLAAAPRLSDKQARAGQKLVRKYQRQLNEDLVRAAGIQIKEAA